MRFSYNCFILFICCFIAACEKPTHHLNLDPEFKKSKQYNDSFNKKSNGEYAQLRPLVEKPDPNRVEAAYKKADQFVLNSIEAQYFRSQILKPTDQNILRKIITFSQDMVILTAAEEIIFQEILKQYTLMQDAGVILYSHPDRHVRELVFARLTDKGIKLDDISVRNYTGNLENFSPYSVYIEILEQ